VEKGLVSQAHQIHAHGYRIQNSDFDFPSGKRKSYYIIVGDLQ
jgi:hypothetical protein